MNITELEKNFVLSYYCIVELLKKKICDKKKEFETGKPGRHTEELKEIFMLNEMEINRLVE